MCRKRQLRSDDERDLAISASGVRKLGRGGAQTLKRRAGVLSVFLHAPEPWRISRVQEVYRLTDRRAAQQMVNESDRARGRSIQTLGDLPWADARGYDLALDTSTVTIGGAVNLIVEAAKAGVAATAAAE